MKSKLLLIITMVILSCPKISFGQAPTLGTTSDFVLFSSVGAVSNVGIQYLTLLTGHVGANSGPITNFGNVDGNIYAGGPQSAACAADLTIAYNQLNATVATIFPAALLGNGQTLTPGVHSITGAATLNLDLTLDGLGNPNAVFIFKIQGPFSTNANSKVKLVNGTQACNVFWKVEGLVDMATGTTMRGTVIANNAAINMAVGDTLEGRALSTNGAVTVSGIFAYTPIGCGSPVLVGPLAPTLASAACFALFSEIGPVTNNLDPTLVTGDVGTNSGLTTGFNPLFVTGAIHGVPDGTTAICATDLTNAYNYLNGLPTDITLIAPTLFGHNLVLTPHTYLLGAATQLTDTFYLDAQGSANAVFVIKINGAFQTTTNSRVVLRNGALAKNVYWNINGAVSLGSNSIFNGTIVGAGAIDILTGATVNGRALTINGALNVTSSTITIPAGTCGAASPPIIITQPNNQTACSGSSVSFSVSAMGAALTYQWRKGLVNLINGGNISGATTATLTINPASITDVAANYNVVVSGSSVPSATSINVSLTINSSPTITSQPSNQTACIGNSVTFTVAASGTGLTYQWRKGLVNLLNGGNISGATTASLIINPVALTDAALNYNVVVGGTCLPNATSTDASLIIGTSPTITSQPSNQTACVGSSVTFTVAVSGTGLTYQWRKGLVNIVNGGNISGATTASLIINPVALTDAALNYNVVVGGTCLPNATSSDASLIVVQSPTAIANSNSPVCIGSPLNLTTPLLAGGTYSWTSSNGFTSNVQNPIILSSSLSDAGTYSLTVSNGTCSSAPSSVSVSIISCLVDLSIVKTVNKTHPFLGTSVIFTITVTNNGPLNATGVAVTEILQSGYTYVSSTVSTGTYNPSTGVWVIGNMNNGASEILTITADVITGGNYVNTAIVYGNETDNNMNNNVSTIETFPTDFFIPEGFSPNGDDINDLFVIRGVFNYPSNTFTIYNRWGSEVFQATPYQNTWSGKSTKGLKIGGDDLPMGTYFYILDLGDGSPIYKGTIYLSK
jgi:gliding motility-associated-like protein/uncharacterized repeat protein (TIGR01451 family)